jgi:hypothetical protein
MSLQIDEALKVQLYCTKAQNRARPTAKVLQDLLRSRAIELEGLVTIGRVESALEVMRFAAKELGRRATEGERGAEAIILLSQIERCLKNGMTPAQILLGNTPIRCALTDFAANKPSGAIDPLEGVSQDALDGGWTAKGLIAYAKTLEDELAAAKADRDALQAQLDHHQSGHKPG